MSKVTRNLHGGQFGTLYHGSQHELVGDTLTPGFRSGQAHGVEGAHDGGPWAKHGQSTYDVVSATTEERHAWAVGAHGLGRARVHEVEPHPETRIGIENKDHPDFHKNPGVFSPTTGASLLDERPDHGEVVAPSFKVKMTHDTMPGHQGTIPGVNWHEFVRRDPVMRYGQPTNETRAVMSAHEANHPSWDQVLGQGAFKPVDPHHIPDIGWMNTPEQQAHQAAKRAEEGGQHGLFPHPEPTRRGRL